MCIKIVTVVNNFALYNKVIKDNKFINNLDLAVFDNTKENLGISERYNSFINENIKSDSDYWVIFCHQDFGFLKNPDKKLNKLDKNFIYGAVGIKKIKKFSFRHLRFLIVEKNIPVGQILQGKNNFDFFKYGKKVKRPEEVESIDCCCIILHSSLINKYNLRFDENLKFHMYAEELCIYARKNYGINTKVIQLNCYHLGEGTINNDFHNYVSYVKNKHNLDKIICTTSGKHREEILENAKKKYTYCNSSE